MWKVEIRGEKLWNVEIRSKIFVHFRGGGGGWSTLPSRCFGASFWDPKGDLHKFHSKALIHAMHGNKVTSNLVHT